MTRQALALSLLEEAGSRGVTTAEFMDAGVGSRYSARLLELRKQGHRITSERVREGSWKYVLETGSRAVNGPLRDSSAVERRQDKSEVAGSNPVPGAVQPDATLKLFESAA